MSDQPIYDEQVKDQNTDPSPPVDGSPEVPPSDSHDIEDVEAALLRETQDGSGFESEDELPESDFDGFAEDGVEDSA